MALCVKHARERDRWLDALSDGSLARGLGHRSIPFAAIGNRPGRGHGEMALDTARSQIELIETFCAQRRNCVPSPDWPWVQS